MTLSRVVALLAWFSVACGCSDLRRAQVPDGGPELPDAGDGGPFLVRTVTCDGETGDGKHRVYHQVLRYSDGSASSTCTVRGSEGIASSSGIYYYGQTGQPGGDCFVELAGAFWRLTLAQDERTTIISQRNAANTIAVQGREWMVPCQVYSGS